MPDSTDVIALFDAVAAHHDDVPPERLPAALRDAAAELTPAGGPVELTTTLRMVVGSAPAGEPERLGGRFP